MKLLTLTEKAEALSKLQYNTSYKDKCWLYKKGLSTNRYGQVRFNGKVHLSHRLAAAIYLSLDLDNTYLQVNHKPECTSAFCWNPEHLYIGTQAENMKDVSNKSRSENKICKRCGHIRSLVSTTIRGKKSKRLECNNCRKTRYRRRKNAG